MAAHALQNARAKLVNDPVHGFITIPAGIPRCIIDHPIFQRLRYIRQLGLTHLVYPGAQHTRYQHALGAMHLMQLALATLRQKGHSISYSEEEAALAAILLHDAGHGPFSHCLEGHLLGPWQHEAVSLELMRMLNREMGGLLDEAIAIFTDQHPKRFLHQLISGQLDVDRMDYLLRDSFFSGVVEGRIPDSRLLKMLEIHEGNLVLEIKGIYSVENFLLARRVMYWQVYLHKTVVTADLLLRALIDRAHEICQEGGELPASPALLHLLQNAQPGDERIETSHLTDLLAHFLNIDDSDVQQAIKLWCNHPDYTLRHLAKSLQFRQLPRLTFIEKPLAKNKLEELRQLYLNAHPDTPIPLLHTMVQSGQAHNQAYNPTQAQILLITPQRETIQITQVSRIITPKFLENQDTRPYVLMPKELSHPAKSIVG